MPPAYRDYCMHPACRESVCVLYYGALESESVCAGLCNVSRRHCFLLSLLQAVSVLYRCQSGVSCIGVSLVSPMHLPIDFCTPAEQTSLLEVFLILKEKLSLPLSPYTTSTSLPTPPARAHVTHSVTSRSPQRYVCVHYILDKHSSVPFSSSTRHPHPQPSTHRHPLLLGRAQRQPLVHCFSSEETASSSPR